MPSDQTSPARPLRVLPLEHRPERLDEYALNARLRALTIAERWTATYEPTNTPRLAYRLHERPTPRALVRLNSLRGLRFDHLLPIESIQTDESRHAWIVCPYMGDASGVMTLAESMARQGGTLPVIETDHAVAHIRAAFAGLRELGMSHANLTLDQLVLCPHGKLHIELAGVASILDAPAGRAAPRPVADDRAAALLAAHMLTGDANANAATLRAVYSRRQRTGVIAWAIDHAI